MVGTFSDKSALPTKKRELLCLCPKEKNSLPKASLCCSIRRQEIHGSCFYKWQKFQKGLPQGVCCSSVLAPEIFFFLFKIHKKFPVLGSCRAEDYVCKVFVSFGQKMLKSDAGIKPMCVSVFSWKRQHSCLKSLHCIKVNISTKNVTVTSNSLYFI